ncbi:MotA/TolQ/ExbB proton channel family protein [Coraliomargarita sp. W4R72]
MTDSEETADSIKVKRSMLDELDSKVTNSEQNNKSSAVDTPSMAWKSVSYLDPSRSQTLFLGVVFTLIFYVLVYAVGASISNERIKGILDIFLKPRNLIVVVPACGLFFWGIAILIIKRLRLRKQKSALAFSIIPQDPTFVLNAETAKLVLGRLEKTIRDPDQFLLLRRIRISISNLRNLGQVSDVSEILRAESEEDVARHENSYALIHSFVWAVPVLGFIGTAIGLSVAIGDFGNVLAGANDLSAIKESLGAVTSGLGTAFETTLVGLFLALFLQMLAAIQEDEESKFLNDCSVYCQEAIVSRLRISSEK